MTFYKTTAMFGATACLLMASTAYGDNVTNTFETANGGWDGGSITVGDVSVPALAGLPVNQLGDPNHVYSISGSASNTTYSTSTTNPFVDMMVKVSRPDEELSGLPEGVSDAKFAVAVESNGVFKCYSSSGWQPLSTSNYVADTWVRVTMKFDYTNKKCTVALDGNTCGTYDLIDNNASTLASIEIRGSTEIDEVLVADDGATPAFASNEAVAENATATKKWLTENDVTWPESPTSEQVAKLDTQYKLGLNPKNTDVTELPLSFVQDGNSGTATLSFPGLGAYGGTGSYVLQSSDTGAANSWSDVGATIGGNAGAKTATIQLNTLTAGQVKYYRILAQPGS